MGDPNSCTSWSSITGGEGVGFAQRWVGGLKQEVDAANAEVKVRGLGPQLDG